MNDNELFWLARYTHNTLAPLFAEAKTLEPSIQFHIEMNFADKTSSHHKDNSLGVHVHWAREGLFLMAIAQRSKPEIDRLAEQVKDKIAGLKDTQEISVLLETVSV